MYAISEAISNSCLWSDFSLFSSVSQDSHLFIHMPLKKFKPIELSLSLPFYPFSSLFQLFTK